MPIFIVLGVKLSALELKIDEVFVRKRERSVHLQKSVFLIGPKIFTERRDDFRLAVDR